jgi:hypothetical protein
LSKENIAQDSQDMRQAPTKKAGPPQGEELQALADKFAEEMVANLRREPKPLLRENGHERHDAPHPHS